MRGERLRGGCEVRGDRSDLGWEDWQEWATVTPTVTVTKPMTVLPLLIVASGPEII